SLLRRLPRSTLFPYTTLFRSVRELSSRAKNSNDRGMIALASEWPPNIAYAITIGDLRFPMAIADLMLIHEPLPRDRVSVAFMPTDRKSTRLNSSHQIISYAVF